MNIFVYSDESGVFDYLHNKFYVFGGLIFLSKEDKDLATRKYLAVEKIVRNNEHLKNSQEVKASVISFKSRTKLYKSLNNVEKFAAVINQSAVHKEIFNSKKTKQRFLDYAFKIALKRKLEKLISEKIINPSEVENIYICVDEHTTATDGIYELRESLEQEFKNGNFNYNFNVFHKPILPQMKVLSLNYCNSSKNTLVRAADIVANKIFYLVENSKLNELSSKNILIVDLPF